MPSCYICGNQIDEPQIDPRDMKVMPCGECLDAVDEILSVWDGEEEGAEFDVGKG